MHTFVFVQLRDSRVRVPSAKRPARRPSIRDPSQVKVLATHALYVIRRVEARPSDQNAKTRVFSKRNRPAVWPLAPRVSTSGPWSMVRSGRGASLGSSGLRSWLNEQCLCGKQPHVHHTHRAVHTRTIKHHNSGRLWSEGTRATELPPSVRSADCCTLAAARPSHVLRSGPRVYSRGTTLAPYKRNCCADTVASTAACCSDHT